MERLRYSIWIIALFVVISVLVQSKLPLWLPRISWLDLPLIVTIYFGLSYRDSIRGMSIGVVAGLLQDALSHGPLGINGVTKTVVGFFTSSVSGRIEVEHTVIRMTALWLFSVVDLGVFAVLEKIFFASRFSWAHYHFVFTPILNAVIGLPLFYLGDRLRKRD
ncbi:MAG: rod shape-determining protein MreD [Acidobacteriia bacterium]|nr:rod shape-determining protein MreD [Terriglobia bacterium]